MRKASVRDGSHNLTTAKRHERPLGILAVRMVQFRRVDTRKSDVNLVDDYRVAINDPAMALDDLLPNLLVDLAQGFRWKLSCRRDGYRYGAIAIGCLLVSIRLALGSEQFCQKAQESHFLPIQVALVRQAVSCCVGHQD